jgi:hypothetical protein
VTRANSASRACRRRRPDQCPMRRSATRLPTAVRSIGGRRVRGLGPRRRPPGKGAAEGPTSSGCGATRNAKAASCWPSKVKPFRERRTPRSTRGVSPWLPWTGKVGDGAGLAEGIEVEVGLLGGDPPNVAERR